MPSRLIVLLALVTLLAPQDPQRPPTFRTEANFVRVDVFPTLKGAPVKDLEVEDFEVLEDGVPQKLSTFEYVQVRTGTPEELREEPNTIQQSRDAMKNPRARVFVIFLDAGQTTIGGAWHSREPLIRLMDRLMGPEDLVGFMTPEMAPSDIVFARKTRVMAEGLRDGFPWGERHTLHRDEIEQMTEACFPWKETEPVVKEMILRKRERATLEALDSLVTFLRDEREERTAIITLSEGWLLYKPNADLPRPRFIAALNDYEPIPGPEPIGVDPGGRLRLRPNDNPFSGSRNECHALRLSLSMIDNDRYFRDVIDKSNRANASFYTIDPRGLPVFDYPIGPEKPPTLITDANHLKARTDNLRVLADNTDGIAILNNNNLDTGLRRISDDLTSYYLLGYYSSNTKFDGRFRRLTVKVKRPGVDVRARRGYKAATEAEVTAAKAAATAPPVSEAVAAARASLGGLARIRPEAKLYVHAIAVSTPAPTVWVAGELAKAPAGATSATVNITVDGAATAIDVPLAAGQRTFLASTALKTAPKGAIDVRVRVAPPGEVIPVTDGVRVEAVAGLPLPMMTRRGPSTGNRYVPAAVPQFSRTERARFDIPKVGDLALTAARVINRDLTVMEVPVTIGATADWLTAEVTLAALGMGDYLVELSGTSGGKTHTVLAPFRVLR